jgi:hypothetical protein
MEEQILRLIFWEVRKRISGKGKFMKDTENVTLCKMWNIEGTILVPLRIFGFVWSFKTFVCTLLVV